MIVVAVAVVTAAVVHINMSIMLQSIEWDLG